MTLELCQAVAAANAALLLVTIRPDVHSVVVKPPGGSGGGPSGMTAADPANRAVPVEFHVVQAPLLLLASLLPLKKLLVPRRKLCLQGLLALHHLLHLSCVPAFRVVEADLHLRCWGCCQALSVTGM